MRNYQCLILSAALCGSTFVLAEAPVVESVPTAEKATPVTVVRVPASNDQAIGELLMQFQQLQMDLASLRGQVEELSYELNQLRTESKDRYIDLDRRISEVRSTAQNSAPPTVTQIAPIAIEQTPDVDAGLISSTTDPVAIEQPPLVIDPAMVQEAYNQAKDLIRQKDYTGAITAFNGFVKDYPNDTLTANAWYWLGEVYLVLPDVDNAVRSFSEVVKNYPKHQKHPDSLYRLGVTLLKTDNAASGRQYLETLIQRYPDSQLSARAKQALAAQ
jgi:tol-pal system protein YbgF